MPGQLVKFPATQKNRVITTYDGLNLLDPVNKLPLDVIHQIFSSIVDPRYYGTYSVDEVPADAWGKPELYDRRALLNLSHVCTRWRAITTNISTFWTFIGFKFRKLDRIAEACDRVDTYLERALRAPLYVWIDGRRGITNEGLEMFASRLRLRFEDIRVLHLEEFRTRGRLLEILSLWFAYGRPGLVHTLVLRTSVNGGLKLNHLRFRAPEQSQQIMDSFLEPIRVLRLSMASFSWDSPVYHNLVVFELDFMGEIHSPTVPEFLNILSVCPRLRTLVLGYICFKDYHPHLWQPVTLDALEHIEFGDSEGLFLARVLPLISCGPQPLSVKLSSPWGSAGLFADPHYEPAIQLFLPRTNTTKLAIPIHSNVGVDQFAAFLSALPNLQTLVISYHNQGGDNLAAAFIDHPEASIGGTPRCPKLSALHLEGGFFVISTLQKLLQVHPLIKELSLTRCCIPGYTSEEALSELKPFVQRMRCEPGPTPYWYRRKMLGSALY